MQFRSVSPEQIPGIDFFFHIIQYCIIPVGNDGIAGSLEGFQIVNKVQREEWTKSVEAAKERALNEQGVQFLYPDTAPFQEACAPLHEEVISGNPTLEAIYAKIQEYNAMYRTAE